MCLEAPCCGAATGLHFSLPTNTHSIIQHSVDHQLAVQHGLLLAIYVVETKDAPAKEDLFHICSVLYPKLDTDRRHPDLSRTYSRATHTLRLGGVAMTDRRVLRETLSRERLGTIGHGEYVYLGRAYTRTPRSTGHTRTVAGRGSAFSGLLICSWTMPWQ